MCCEGGESLEWQERRDSKDKETSTITGLKDVRAKILAAVIYVIIILAHVQLIYTTQAQKEKEKKDVYMQLICSTLSAVAKQHIKLSLERSARDVLPQPTRVLV